MRFLLLLAALPAALAAKQTIQVGTQGLQFLPNTIYAQVDDTVEFLWSSPEHSVTQGMFGSPCTPTEGGVNSGLLDMTKTFTITLNDTNPIWLYCAVAGHCQSGMVMVINPPSTSQTLDAYRGAAANMSPGTQPSAVSGGVVGEVSAVVESASATLAATGAATQTTSGSTATAKSGAGKVSGWGGLAGVVAVFLL